MLEPEDYTALKAQWDGAALAAAATAVRMQAAAQRSMAELCVSQAETLERMADDLVEGRAEMSGPRVRFRIVREDDEPEAVEREDGDEWRVEELADGGEISTEMAKFLDDFDDRLRRSPHFITAVNEAAENSLMLNKHTASLIGERVRELTEEAAQKEGY